MIHHLYENQILIWADAYRDATGQWLTEKSGPVAESRSETWADMDRALQEGLLGLPGGSSLSQLLAEHRNLNYARLKPALSEEQILAWADAHERRTGKWPTTGSGAVLDAPAEDWFAIDCALRGGRRGLPGGSSLAKLLADKREVRNRRQALPLTTEAILAWADAWFQRTNQWPNSYSGEIPAASGDTWMMIDAALRQGSRGLSDGSSLARLLAEHRGRRNRKDLPPLTLENILTWADVYR